MRYLTISEAAEALSLSVPTIKRYIYEGKLKSTKLPGGQHRIPESEVDRLLTPQGPGDTPHTEVTPDERIAVLERWVTDLEAEIERLTAALEVVSRYCGRTSPEEAPAVPPTSTPEVAGHTVLVLGPGCRKCRELYELTGRVVRAMGRADVSLQHVTDLDDIAAFGPILTPALVIDGQLVLTGRVPNERAIRELLQRHLG